MTEENIETNVPEEEGDEPIYYKPKTLSLVATIATVTSWLVLVGFVLVIVAQGLVLKDLAEGTTIAELLANPSAKNFIYSNLVIPLLTGLGMFVTLQAAGIGLNVLLEIDFNMREN